jgi:anthranilate phosphoribosyltransferase
LTLAGATEVAEVRDGSPARVFQITPEDAGLAHSEVREPHGGDAAANAAILAAIFSGERGPRRDVVLLNAAAALVAAEVASDFKEGVARGVEAIDSGAVRGKVEALREFSRAHAAAEA